MASLVRSLTLTARKRKQEAKAAPPLKLLSVFTEDGHLAFPWKVSDEDANFFETHAAINVVDFFQGEWVIMNLSEHRSTSHDHLDFPIALVIVQPHH